MVTPWLALLLCNKNVLWSNLSLLCTPSFQSPEMCLLGNLPLLIALRKEYVCVCACVCCTFASMCFFVVLWWNSKLPMVYQAFCSMTAESRNKILCDPAWISRSRQWSYLVQNHLFRPCDTDEILCEIEVLIWGICIWPKLLLLHFHMKYVCHNFCTTK